MSYAVSTRPTFTAEVNLRDEYSSRRSVFRSGSSIELLDGQTWILPAPPKKFDRNAIPFESAYFEIIQAMLEAEDSSEQCMAELTFAIFLLGHNYDLSSEDYQELLGSSTDSPGTSDWQLAFREVAQEHIHAFLNATRGSFAN